MLPTLIAITGHSSEKFLKLAIILMQRLFRLVIFYETHIAAFLPLIFCGWCVLAARKVFHLCSRLS